MTGADVLNFDTDRMVSPTTFEEARRSRTRRCPPSATTRGTHRAVHVGTAPQSRCTYALLDDLLDELRGRRRRTAGDHRRNPRGGVDGSNTIMERLRVAARDNPTSTLAALYDRFAAVGSPRPAGNTESRTPTASTLPLDDFGDWLAATPTARTRARRRTRRPRPQVWIEQSYVPEYEPQELKDIPSRTAAPRARSATGAVRRPRVRQPDSVRLRPLRRREARDRVARGVVPRGRLTSGSLVLAFAVLGVQRPRCPGV